MCPSRGLRHRESRTDGTSHGDEGTGDWHWLQQRMLGGGVVWGGSARCGKSAGLEVGRAAPGGLGGRGHSKQVPSKRAQIPVVCSGVSDGVSS